MEESITLTWPEILSGASTGMIREVETLRQNIKWGHGQNANTYQKWGQTISGCICEMALAKKMDSYFNHSVNNFWGKDIIINKKPVQIKSQLMSKQEKFLTIRPKHKPEDYYFLVIDDMPTFYFYGYIQAKHCQKYGIWTNQNIPSRPHFWKIPIDKLKPISQFKYEKQT